MTRNKVKLAWIVNDNARKSSFKKRNACLVKKMSELTTLCDISAFVIVYGEDGEESTVWPDRKVSKHSRSGAVEENDEPRDLPEGQGNQNARANQKDYEKEQ
ncbi:hypothetical protein ACFX2B_013233 [Malus domestica]